MKYKNGLDVQIEDVIIGLTFLIIVFAVIAFPVKIISELKAQEPIRSKADIDKIEELETENAELETENAELETALKSKYENWTQAVVDHIMPLYVEGDTLPKFTYGKKVYQLNEKR